MAKTDPYWKYSGTCQLTERLFHTYQPEKADRRMMSGMKSEQTKMGISVGAYGRRAENPRERKARPRVIGDMATLQSRDGGGLFSSGRDMAAAAKRRATRCTQGRHKHVILVFRGRDVNLRHLVRNRHESDRPPRAAS